MMVKALTSQFARAVGGLVLLLTSGISGTAEVSPTAHDYRDPNFDYFVVGDPALPRAAHTEFALLLMGGGGYVDAAYASIARHAGGGHIVILRAAADEKFNPGAGEYGRLFASRWGPVTSAQTIVFRRREASFDPRVIAALNGADGIFLAGGDQGDYIRYWKGTPVQAALNAHVRANRPIGGSSAGLAILGHYSYTSLDGGSMESKIALADPFNAGVTLEGNFLHLRGLEEVITDTHFSKRCRLGRLIAFLARINAHTPRPPVFGIGMDERTAMMIGENGIGHIVSGSAGAAWIVTLDRPAEALMPGQPLTLKDIHISRLDSSGILDLKRRRVDHPSAETREPIERGVASENSLVTPLMMRNVVPKDED